MQVFSSLTVKAGYKVTSGIDKVEFRVVQLATDIYKNKFDTVVKASELNKTVDRKNNVSTVKIKDISVIFVDGVVTEVQPSASQEAKELIRAIKSSSKIENIL